MTTQRKLIFTALILSVVILAIEGTARVAWSRLEAKSFGAMKNHGAEVLKNDAVNFMKVPDGEYGYRLKENFSEGGVYINAQGFHQREVIPEARKDGFLRVACLGESTTFGSSVDVNYPAYLKKLLQESPSGYRGVEVINAGVPGWISDQVALRAHYQLTRFRPDVVILYTGWNDFQTYDPLGRPPQESAFRASYGDNPQWKQIAEHHFRAIAILSALYRTWRNPHPDSGYIANPDFNPPELRYKYLRENITNIIADFRRANPEVKIFVSTLAGLWPQGSPADWAHRDNVWWASYHHLGKPQVARYLGEFNDQLRLAGRSGESTRAIEIASGFESLDRVRLLSDWAHMHPDGYELMACMMFAAMRDAGIVKGELPRRYSELLAAYRLPGAAAQKNPASQ